MARWQRTLTLNPEWDRAKEHEISLQELAGSIAKKLRAIRPLSDESVADQHLTLIEDFECASTDDDLDTQQFDWLMADLYDWGDTRLDASWNGKKVCWVDTITRVDHQSDGEASAAVSEADGQHA